MLQSIHISDYNNRFKAGTLEAVRTDNLDYSLETFIDFKLLSGNSSC